METELKIIGFGAAVFLIIIVTAQLFFNRQNQPGPLGGVRDLTPDAVYTSATNPAPIMRSADNTQNNATPKTTSAKTTAAQSSYGETLKKYPNYRFQISSPINSGVTCAQITPNSFVIKKGSKFMIDNRDNATNVFAFAKQKFTLPPYGFLVITAQPAGNFYITCNGIRRASINIAP